MDCLFACLLLLTPLDLTGCTQELPNGAACARFDSFCGTDAFSKQGLQPELSGSGVMLCMCAWYLRCDARRLRGQYWEPEWRATCPCGWLVVRLHGEWSCSGCPPPPSFPSSSLRDSLFTCGRWAWQVKMLAANANLDGVSSGGL